MISDSRGSKVSPALSSWSVDALAGSALGVPGLGRPSGSAPIPGLAVTAVADRATYRRGRGCGPTAGGSPPAVPLGLAGAACSAGAVSRPTAPPLLAARLMPLAPLGLASAKSASSISRPTGSAADVPFRSAPSSISFVQEAAASSRTPGSVPPAAERRTNQLSCSVVASDPAPELEWRSIDQSPADVAYRSSSAPVYAGIVTSDLVPAW